jgi:hypothetical protein
MYTVEQYNPEIRLISNLRGVVDVYPYYESFLDNIDYSFIERRIVTTFRDWPHTLTWPDFLRVDETFEIFVARDKFGSVFSSNEIRKDFVARRRTSQITTEWYRVRYDFIYRKTPVPRTGKRNWTFTNWYKKPRTTQERRWACAHGKYVRGKRRSHVLPDTYDDMPRGDIDNRKCWKNKKIGRQWMKNS